MEGISWAQCGEKDCGLLCQSLHLKSPHVASSPYLTMPIMNSPPAFSRLADIPDTDKLDEKLVPPPALLFFLFLDCTTSASATAKRKDKPSKCLRISRDLKWSLRKWRKLPKSWSACEKVMEDVAILQTGAAPKWQACADQRGAATDGNWDSVALVRKRGPGADRRLRDLLQDVGGQIIRVFFFQGHCV